MKLEIFKKKHDFLDTLSKSLASTNQSIFPNIHTLLCIIYTLPETSSEHKQNWSVLCQLKTWMHSTMGKDRMTGLALKHVKYGMELNLEEII